MEVTYVTIRATVMEQTTTEGRTEEITTGMIDLATGWKGHRTDVRIQMLTAATGVSVAETMVRGLQQGAAR